MTSSRCLPRALHHQCSCVTTRGAWLVMMETVPIGPAMLGGFGYLVSFTPASFEVWDGDAVALADGLAISVSGIIANGREFGTPPAAYVPERFFAFDPDCGCYLRTELVGNLLEFEAWVYHADEGSGEWVYGCMESTGSAGPGGQFPTSAFFQS